MPNRIIVVDDDTSNLKIAGHILSRNEMHVTALHSGQALLDLMIGGETCDLILLDIKMPYMDGFETLDRLRVIEREIGADETPVIFLTADDNSDTEKHGFEAGVSDYIKKPFDPEILIRRVGNVIEKQKKLKSLRAEASTDKLTGFLNKAAASAELSKLCTSQQGCLMMIDLDSFKLVNDIHGHKMGDSVLIAFADILRAAAPEGSRIGRIGGDEFAMFALGMNEASEVARFTERINTELMAKAKQLMGEEMDIPLGASVGGVFVPRHGNDCDTLLKMADKVLYTVKKNGKHGCALYHTDAYTDEAGANALDINKLSEILGERAIPNVALQLDKDVFTYVYRYVMRYMIRNHKSACKVLYTLSPGEGTDEARFSDLCDEFGLHIRDSLRKSDILMRIRSNQYFILLTDIREDSIRMVVENIVKHWRRKQGDALVIDDETRFVGAGSESSQPTALRIAVADDNSADLTSVGRCLSQAGYHVSAVRSGRALMKFIEETLPDIILLDAQLSEEDSFEVLWMLKAGERTAKIPVLLMTESSDPELIKRSLELGAADIITKPILPELLLARVRGTAELIGYRRRLGR